MGYSIEIKDVDGVMAAVFDLDDAIPFAQAGEMLPELPERLAAGQGAISLTKHGKPMLVVMTWELFESLCETVEIMSDPELMSSINAGRAQGAEGRTIPLDELKARLDV